MPFYIEFVCIEFHLFLKQKAVMEMLIKMTFIDLFS